MPRRTIDDIIERRRREDVTERYVDLALDVVDEVSKSVVLAAGGRWDRREKRYSHEPAKARRMSIHPGQLPATLFFVAWLGRWFRHKFGREPIAPADRVYSLILSGGQRSGKTWIGILLAVVYAVTVPGSIVWIVCPTEKDFEEVQDYLRNLMPADWYSELGFPWWRYSLSNGSRIVLRSGHKPEALKKGDADLIVVNEAQQQDERVFNISRLRIASSGALVIVCANPPEQPIGYWVADRILAAERGEIQAKHFHLDPFDNPHIDHGPMLAFKKEVDQRTFDIEVRGKLVGAKNAVFYNWDFVENEQRAPDVTQDVTALVTKAREGREYDRVIGLDFQRRPMVGVEVKWFWNPRTTPDRSRFDRWLGGQGGVTPAEAARWESWWRWQLTWATREWMLDRANEDDLLAQLLDDGCDPKTTLIVADASGDYQYAERSKEKLERMEVRGRGSHDVFERAGFRVVKPDKNQERNPNVLERFATATARIKLAQASDWGERFLFVDPQCKELVQAVRNYPNKNGTPHRFHRHAHLSDAFTYVVHRFHPRLSVGPSTEIKVVKRLQGRSRMQGW